MPLVTTTTEDGFATCSRDRMEHGHCEGYTSRPIKVEREIVVRLFGDEHGDWNDPYARAQSNSFEYLRAADPADAVCPHCGSPANISLTARKDYPRLSKDGPDELMRARELERMAELHQREAVLAGERSATATEQLVVEQQRTNALREREVAALEERNRLERIRLGVEPNGDGEPEPKRRTAKT